MRRKGGGDAVCRRCHHPPARSTPSGGEGISCSLPRCPSPAGAAGAGRIARTTGCHPERGWNRPLRGESMLSAGHPWVYRAGGGRSPPTAPTPLPRQPPETVEPRNSLPCSRPCGGTAGRTSRLYARAFGCVSPPRSLLIRCGNRGCASKEGRCGGTNLHRILPPPVGRERINGWSNGRLLAIRRKKIGESVRCRLPASARAPRSACPGSPGACG